MTVRVVLEFKDEVEAKRFCKASLLSGIGMVEACADSVRWISNETLELIGVFKKPTLYCNPSDGHRGKKYGWWVCGICGKPTERWANGDLWPYSMGFNLLPKSISRWARPDWDTATQWTEEDLGCSGQE